MTKSSAIFQPDAEYRTFFQEVKAQVQQARSQAATSVNRHLIALYWSIGQGIVERQERLGWGKSVVEQLSKDLQAEFTGQEGFSAPNLWKMRQLYQEYKSYQDLSQLVIEVPWGHNVLIMNKVKDPEVREYYLRAVADYGWTRDVLRLQIEGQAYQRRLKDKKAHNFEQTLTPALAEQADKAMKSVYSLELLGIQKPVLERELERRMVNRIRDVMLEFGRGFAFIGNQHRLSAGGKDYLIDLLFYHRDLRCLVAMEIKTGEFKAEYAGKMNLYLGLLDDLERREGELPSIGIILCAEKNHVEVEYALKDIHKPIQVAEYRLTKELPPELQGKLPQPEDLAAEIRLELEADETSLAAQDISPDAVLRSQVEARKELHQELYGTRRKKK